MTYRTRLVLGIALTAPAMLLVLLPAVTASATSGLMRISTDTTLTENHSGGIEVTANDVTLDCGGHEVLGSGTGKGIEITGRTGVTVRNCNVSGFEHGITLGLNSDNNRVDGNTSRENSANGINLFSADANTVADNKLNGNGLHGLAAYQSSGLTIEGNTVSGNGEYGMKIRETDKSQISSNFVSGNGLSGIFNDGGSDIEGNHSHRNGDWGFEIQSAGVVSQNLCIDNALGGSTPTGRCYEQGHFRDAYGIIFEVDIEWMVFRGITKGCNPPSNHFYCPDGFVTRGQMAAFLVRALKLTDQLDDPFTDDDDSIFEADIEKLAAAGITKGCNPSEGNTRFCPNRKVTRAQMAAFLVRALGYTDNGGGDLFEDDDGSIFETDIDKLGTAGVTKGCNPSEGNTKFCPDRYVTRGQMAAFLHRALGH